MFFMTLDEVMVTLEKLGSEQSKKVLTRHGAREPFFGVKIADMKKELARKIKRDYKLSLELFKTGNSDAMYLAGLVSEPDKMTKTDLTNWINRAYWYMLSECTVAWVAAESNYGWELGLEWIESDNEIIGASGWSTLAAISQLKSDEELDIDTYNSLLERIEESIHASANRVRYAMNGFIITVGSSIKSLNGKAKDIAERIGKISVYMGQTSCKVPYAPDYIKKVEEKGRIGKKKKSVIC